MPDLKENKTESGAAAEDLNVLRSAGADFEAFKKEAAAVEQRIAETAAEKIIETKEGGGSPEEPAGAAITGVQPRGYAIRQKKIERVMEDGLAGIYQAMPPDKQQEFRMAGERTAREINAVLQAAKIKVNKIINLIRKWLSLIQGVNLYFLEKEAKRKADEIVKFKN